MDKISQNSALLFLGEYIYITLLLLCVVTILNNDQAEILVTNCFFSGPVDKDKIIKKKLPGGKEIEQYPLFGSYVSPAFAFSGFVPDPREHLPAVRDMPVFDDDVLICAYPKAGLFTLILPPICPRSHF